MDLLHDTELSGLKKQYAGTMASIAVSTYVLAIVFVLFVDRRRIHSALLRGLTTATPEQVEKMNEITHELIKLYQLNWWLRKLKLNNLRERNVSRIKRLRVRMSRWKRNVKHIIINLANMVKKVGDTEPRSRPRPTLWTRATGIFNFRRRRPMRGEEYDGADGPGLAEESTVFQPKP